MRLKKVKERLIKITREHFFTGIAFSTFHFSFVGHLVDVDSLVVQAYRPIAGQLRPVAEVTVGGQVSKKCDLAGGDLTA